MVANQGDQQDVKLAACEPAEDKSRALVWKGGATMPWTSAPLFFFTCPGCFQSLLNRVGRRGLSLNPGIRVPNFRCVI